MTPTLRALGMLFAGAVLLSSSSACSDAASVDAQDLNGAVEQGGEELTTNVVAGATLRTTGTVNMRNWPATTSVIARILPKGTKVIAKRAAPVKGFYEVTHNGLKGWVSGNYLSLVDEGDGDGDPNDTPAPAPTTAPKATSRENVITRAKSVVGFSYWWGHGRWTPDGATSSNRGSCSGDCGACSHKGSYGADCSGFIAKAWQVPSTNSDLTVDAHPYNTASFSQNTSQWTAISRSSVQKADAFVYREGGAGHIVLYSSGDAWNALNAYECKACASGCVYNLRTLSSAYKAIRRSGW